jgi:hypothetical protein
MLPGPQTRAAVLVSALLVGSAVVAIGCGAERSSPRSRASLPGSSAAGTPGATVPVEACRAPVADPALVRDRDLAGALPAGPLVVYPADDITRIPRADRGRVIGPKVVVITTGAKPVTLRVGRPARGRFSLLFAVRRRGGRPPAFAWRMGSPRCASQCAVAARLDSAAAFYTEAPSAFRSPCEPTADRHCGPRLQSADLRRAVLARCAHGRDSRHRRTRPS